MSAATYYPLQVSRSHLTVSACETRPDIDILLYLSLLLRSTWILLYRPFYSMGKARNPIMGAREACNQCASEIYSIFVYFERNFGVLQLHFSYIYA